MKYDPDAAPDLEKWLALEETQRIELVSVYHHRLSVKLPNDQLHAAIHVIVESQLPEEAEVTTDPLARLRAEGLDRHEAIHAIGSVLMRHVRDLLRSDAKPPDSHAPYFEALQRLTASSWREEFGTTRKRTT